MTKTITVNVTQEDIETGIANDCLHCPIALAIHRSLPGSVPRVRIGGVTLWGCNSSGVATLPDEAQSFIYHFDDGVVGAPFQFILTFHEFRDFTNPSQPQA